MTANIRCSTSWKHSWDRFISGKLPKQLCIISARVRASCVFMCVWKTECTILNRVSKEHRLCLQPASSPFDISQTVYRCAANMQADESQGGLWPLNLVCWCFRLLWLQHLGMLLAIIFHFYVLYFPGPLFFFFLNVIPQQFYLLLESFPLSFAHSLYMPFYIPLPSNETLLFICPPPCTATLHCSFTLCSLPSSHCTPLPCIRFSSGI